MSCGQQDKQSHVQNKTSEHLRTRWKCVHTDKCHEQTPYRRYWLTESVENLERRHFSAVFEGGFSTRSSDDIEDCCREGRKCKWALKNKKWWSPFGVHSMTDRVHIESIRSVPMDLHALACRSILTPKLQNYNSPQPGIVAHSHLQNLNRHTKDLYFPTFQARRSWNGETVVFTVNAGSQSNYDSLKVAKCLVI